MRQDLTCRRDQAKGNHVWREPLYRRWQVGLVCSHCGRRQRTQAQLAQRRKRRAELNKD